MKELTSQLQERKLSLLKAYVGVLQDHQGNTVPLTTLMREVLQDARKLRAQGIPIIGALSIQELFPQNTLVDHPQFKFNVSSGEVFRKFDGSTIVLHKRELESFLPLILSPGQLITPDIFTEFWGWHTQGPVDYRTFIKPALGISIYRLRKKIGDYHLDDRKNSQWRFINSLFKRGYFFSKE